MDIEDYAAQHPQLPSERIEPHLLEWLARGEYGTILDVGCGNGRLLTALTAQGLLEGSRARGVDLSKTNVERARAHLPDVRFDVDNAETLAKVGDGEIDFLISTQVLEHVDDERMLASVARVLAPDGVAYISTVFKRPWARFIWRTESGEWALDPTHLREYTSDAELVDRVSATGLSVVDSAKEQVAFPILDFVLRRLPVDRESALSTSWARTARRAKVPIPGYFTWSLVLSDSGTQPDSAAMSNATAHST